MGEEEKILPYRDEIRKACRFMEENLDKPEWKYALPLSGNPAYQQSQKISGRKDRMRGGWRRKTI